MSYVNKIDSDEILNDFIRIMHDTGKMSKKASFSLPASLLPKNTTEQIDLYAEMRKKASKAGADNLYGLFSDDVMKDAHKGNAKIVDAADGLGEVETLESAHEKGRAIAEAKVKVASEVFRLAEEIDQGGFIALAKKLDRAASAFIG